MATSRVFFGWVFSGTADSIYLFLLALYSTLNSRGKLVSLTLAQRAPSKPLKPGDLFHSHNNDRQPGLVGSVTSQLSGERFQKLGIFKEPGKQL